MDERSNHHAPWIREYPRELHKKAVEMGLGALPVSILSHRLFLNVGGITVTIEGIWSITRTSTEAEFEEWVKM